MEVTGVVIGAVALVSAFETCVKLMSHIGAAKSMESDYMRLETKFDFQKTILLQWADRLELQDQEQYDIRLDDPHIGPMVMRGLECIRQLLEDGHALQQRYGVRPVEEGETTVSPSVVSSRLMSYFRQKSQALRLRRKDPPSQSDLSKSPYDLSSAEEEQGEPRFAKITWVVKDKEKFEGLIRELSDLINNIDRVVPPRGLEDIARHALSNEIQRLHDIPNLRSILNALIDDKEGLADVTRQTIDKTCRQSILNRLWFRLIDNRKDLISEAHSKTFEWAIHPPTSEDMWDNLGEWLRSGRGSYWIYGKPGSGKSTLMKYLYSHPKVTECLQQWAGDRKLTTASFFLWNLGSVEQKSQQGLARGLLHHVLSQNQALIPAVLPHMWQEAQNGAPELGLPSDIEMQNAFQRLGTESTNGAYAIFIDGLDEFTGDLTDGISFVQSFATFPNIKILLSSRPYDTCEAAFSGRPKLGLHDLTKHDIETYINDTIRSHRYVADYMYANGAVVDHLIKDLRDKAEGVFLWVVLACRTLIAGFVAGDRRKELQQRVDELPPKLNALFRQILDGLPARDLSQTAKLLRVCYNSTLLQISGSVSTLALAWADEKEMDSTAMEGFTQYSTDEMQAQCTLLERRLRSRCRGLLEIHRHSDGASPTESSRIETSSVGFMHRTVFEFLSDPTVWEMRCLQVHDDGFDATTVLSFMSCYLLYLQGEPIRRKPDLLKQTLAYVQHIDRTSPSQTPRILDRFALALTDPCPTSGKRKGEQFFDSSGNHLSLSHATRILAVEADLMGCIREQDVRSYNASRRQQDMRTSNTSRMYHDDPVEKSHIPYQDDPVGGIGLLYPDDPTEGSNLLYHAIKTPLMRKFGIHVPLSAAMIATLIKYGCDPNESVLGNAHVMTTPWETWKTNTMRHNSLHMALRAAEITASLIRGGAMLKPPSPNGLTVQTAGKDWRSEIISATGVWLDIAENSTQKSLHDCERLRECCNEIVQAVVASHGVTVVGSRERLAV